MRTPRVFHRLRALPWISVGTLTFLSAMAYLSLDRASTPIALVFVGFGLFVAITILFEPFAIRIRDDQLASASSRFDMAEMCERFNIRQPNLSTKTNYELHDMKQALALIFAAGRVGGAEQTPRMVTDGVFLQSVALAAMLHKMSTQGTSVLSWAGLLTPRRLSLLSSL